MISGIKSVIARCIDRIRQGACATCDNRTFCPAGRWQHTFGEKKREPAQSGGGVFGFLGELLQSLSAEPKPRCFKMDVEIAIEPILASGEVSIDRVARQLGMSRQTLYRRLKAEDVTFEEVLDAKRRRLAIRYIGMDRISVKGAAYKLGFSDPAAFSRAFKRWTGISPSRFRTA